MISRLIALAETVRPETPTKFAPVALAFSAVHSLAVWPCAGFFSVKSARPKSTPVRFRPVGSLLPPLMPAKALRPEPPMSSCSTATGVAASLSGVVNGRSPSVTLALLRLSASAPETRKKPKASTVMLPLALVTSPKDAARSSVIVLGLATVPV